MRRLLPLSALFVSAASAGAIIDCAAGNGSDSTSTVAASQGASVTVAASSASASGASTASASATGTGGQGGSGGAKSTSASGAGGATGGAGGAGGAGGVGGSGGAPTGTVVMIATGSAAALGGEFHPAMGWATTPLTDASDDSPTLALSSPTDGVAVIRSTQNAGELRYAVWNPGAWTPFAQVKAAVTTRATPHALTVAGTVLLTFHGDDFKHYFATFASGVWAPTNEPVQSGAQAFGPSPASLFFGPSGVSILYGGNDHDLYEQSRTGPGVWTNGASLKAGDFTLLTPAVVSMTQGTPDLMVVAVRKDGVLATFEHTPKGWVGPMVLDPGAITNDPVAFVALPKGRALVAYRAPAGDVYYSGYDPQNKPPWSIPSKVTNGATSQGTPGLAPGVGGADAELAYVDATGAAFHTRWVKGLWQAPSNLGGSGLTRVALASSP